MTSREDAVQRVAIIGMSGRFPGARSISEFWQNLVRGVESVSHFGEEQLRAAGVTPDVYGHPGYVPARPIIEDALCFDASFFGYSTREAETLDPQQRLLLECCHEALESAGHDASRYPGWIGLFAAVNHSAYGTAHIGNLAASVADPTHALQFLLGNDKDYAATRVGYKLGLKGPCVGVQTACSSSLVAIHLACQALLGFQCDMVLAGASSIDYPSTKGHLGYEGGIFAREPHCRPFDERASGMLFGDGVGVVLLKRYEDALADGDSILACIRGSAINNDGDEKIGFTAPSIQGQEEVLTVAHVVAGVRASDISFIETHGTGTRLGDAAEVTALRRVFERGHAAPGACTLGALKANIGHTNVAAGVLGVMKTCLALQHETIPPVINFERANAELELESSPFRINVQPRPWPRGAAPRLAGVSSFGMGGTNAHVVLEEAPRATAHARSSPPHTPGWHLVPVSAHSAQALQNQVDSLCAFAKGHPETSLEDFSYTLQEGRRQLRYRQCATVRTLEELEASWGRGAATSAMHEGQARREHGPSKPSVVFFCPGKVSHAAFLCDELYRRQPEFRTMVDRCAEQLTPHVGRDVRGLFLREAQDAAWAEHLLAQPRLVQPALFVVEMAACHLLLEHGLRPDALLGDGVGEYVAAVLAGVCSLETGLDLVARRAAVIPTASSGRPCLSRAGEPHPCDRRLAEFAAHLRGIAWKPPTVPLISSVSGTWVTPRDMTEPDGWCRLLLAPECPLNQAIGTVGTLGRLLMVEAAPSDDPSNPVCSHARAGGSHVLSLFSSGADPGRTLFEILGTCWVQGAELDWNRVRRGAQAQRIALPTYGFERQRYDARASAAAPPPFAPSPCDVATFQAAPSPAVESAADGTKAIPDRADASDGGMSLPGYRATMLQRFREIWCSLLNTGHADPDANFYELGGHSLLAMQMLDALHTTFDVRLPLTIFLECDTFQDLADAVLTACAEPRAPTRDAVMAEPGVSTAKSVEPGVSTARSVAPGGWPLLSASSLSRETGRLHSPFPLTEIQQAYWLGRTDQYELGGVSCYGYSEIRLREGIDLARLELAMNHLIARHDMLHAVVHEDNQQRILSSWQPFAITVCDLRGHTQDGAALVLAALRTEMSHQVLPTDRAPMIDMRACLLPDGTRLLLLGMDLMFVDYWSVQLFQKEVLEHYRNPDVELPALRCSFRDCVLMDRAIKESVEYQRDLAYWMSRCDTLADGPKLPLRSAGSRPRKSRFARKLACIDRGKWESLVRVARQHRIPPSVLLVTAFSEVLSRWSTSPQFTINLTLFNRPQFHEDVHRLIGDFTTTILLEVSPTVGATFAAKAERLRERLWQDLAHNRVSGVEVIRELTRRRPSFVAPVVFTSTLGLEVSSEASDSWLGEEVYGISQTPQVWLDHQVREAAGGVYLIWDYVEDLFPDGMISEMFEAYRELLVRLSEEATWQQPGMLLPGLRSAAQLEANATATVLSEEPLHGAFEKAAARHPQLAAVITEQRVLTYAELDRLASGLARELERRGAKQGALVAIGAKKGWEQVVAVLAILKSQAAYLPLDMTAPNARIAGILAASGCTIVLTESAFSTEAVLWPENLHIIDVTRFESSTPGPCAPHARFCDSSALAYVIYTSGSTGEPKGVMITHRAAQNTISDLNARFAVKESDRVLSLSALNFDLSVYDIFGPLSVGGAVVIPDAARPKDPAHWEDLLRRHGVTLWNTVPALMEMLVEHLQGRGRQIPESLRLVFLSGDWIPVTLPTKVRALHPYGEDRTRLSLISMGGATEAAIWSILYSITDVDPTWKSIPYGKPMANQRFYVLNEHGEPCPTWVAGRLFIGGAGLAAGYWRDEVRTNERFVVHPTTGERLYWTGDLGRYWPDGNIEFLGREDFQIKIQGHRIELEEIEAAMLQHSALQGAIATVVASQTGVQQIAVYYKTKPSHEVIEEELATWVANKLPKYMLPSLWMQMESFPLNGNGKVDRTALPKPSRRVERSTPPNVDVSELESYEPLRRIWMDILQTGAPDPHDSFFEVGGNSLLATRLVNRIGKELGAELSVPTLFEVPTLVALAQRLDQESTTSNRKSAGTDLEHLSHRDAYLSSKEALMNAARQALRTREER